MTSGTTRTVTDPNANGSAKFYRVQITRAGAPGVVVMSDPVGFLTRSSLSNSDTYYSIPFTRPPDFVGAIQSVGASINTIASTSTITVAGAPWVQNQFVYVPGTQPKHYYALIGSAGGPKEGHSYFVTANTNNTVTVDTSGDNLAGVPGTAQLLLIPYWTPDTLFPLTLRMWLLRRRPQRRYTKLKF